MGIRLINQVLGVSAALAVSACGGSGTRVASTPNPPTPTPTPTPTPSPTPGTIIPGLTSSQQFAQKGAFVETPSSESGTLSTTDNSQLKVRYDASTQQYQIQLPGKTSWDALDTYPNAPAGAYRAAGSDYVNFTSYDANGYDYSALANWNSGVRSGSVAIGIPTAASGVPVTGSATYSGEIAGRSTETINDAWGPYSAQIVGSIDLAFNFGAGSLSGSISPTLYVYDPIDLPKLTFSDTVYSVGGTTFSGRFVTSLSGANSFSGLFTGPNAEELIGQWAFPYISPYDGKRYDAGGGFVGKRP